MSEIISEIIELEDGSKRKKWQVSPIALFSELRKTYLRKGDFEGHVNYKGEFTSWQVGSNTIHRVEWKSAEEIKNIQNLKTITTWDTEIDLTKFPGVIIFVNTSCSIYFPLFSSKNIKPALREAN